MTRFLASVQNLQEAMVACSEAVDIIDLKNPAEGALGALPIDEIGAIVKAVAGRKPVSATIGDLPMQPALLVERVALTAQTGVGFVKIGIFGRQGHEACLRALQPLVEKGINIVAVMFADDQPDFDLLPVMAACGLRGVMLDTCRKDGKRLLDWMAPTALGRFVRDAHSLGLMTGLAGALDRRDIDTLVPLGADYLGFRSALCADRNRSVSAEASAMHEIVMLLQKYNIKTHELA